MVKKQKNSMLGDAAYSMRRYYVDAFLCKQFSRIPAGSFVLDVGGHKVRSRGEFSPYEYGLDILCANISNEKGADVLADAACLPFEENTFDFVLCSELIEHVYSPHEVFAEIWRVLKPGGKALFTIPFLYHVHGDPHDFGRYTKSFLMQALSDEGFYEKNILIKHQGKYWSLLADIIRIGLVQGTTMGPSFSSRLCSLGLRVFKIVARTIPSWDEQSQMNGSDRFTTGYEIVVVKS